MQGGKTKTLSVLDEHDGGVGHVDADLDDGRRGEDVDLAFSKSVDDIILRLWRHLAMQHLNACTGNEAANIDRLRLDIVQGCGLSCAAVLVNVEPGNVVELLGRVLRRDHRADDVGLPALGQGISNRPIRDIAAAALERDRRNARTRHGAMANDARIEVTVDRQRQRTRDRRGRHDKKVSARPLTSQDIALSHAKAMLLVNDHER